MPEPLTHKFYQQFVSVGIEYSHRLKFVHHDLNLKPENVKLTNYFIKFVFRYPFCDDYIRITTYKNDEGVAKGHLGLGKLLFIHSIYNPRTSD